MKTKIVLFSLLVSSIGFTTAINSQSTANTKDQQKEEISNPADAILNNPITEVNQTGDGENKEKIKINGYVRNYMGGILSDPYNYSIIQNTLDLSFEKKTDKVALKANPVLYHYIRDNNKEELELLLREGYLDLFFSSMDLRIGKQQIIWGKADGVFITDVVSPKDLSEFLLPDFEEIRMGVNAVKSNFYIGDHTLELIWLPVFTPTQLPATGSIWRPDYSSDFPVAPNVHDAKQVSNKFENSEAFAKYSLMSSIIDIEVMGGYTWDDDPSMHIKKSATIMNMKPVPAIDVYPEYHRLGLGGGSFSSTIGPVVLRGEGAYYSGKHFNTEDEDAKDALVEKDYANYMAGVDYTLPGDVKTSVQFIQKYIVDYDSKIVDDEFQNLATFLISRDFINETLNLQLFVYYDIDSEASLVRPKISYKYADGFTILLGANIFTGSVGMFGQYSDNNMLYTKLTYDF